MQTENYEGVDLVIDLFSMTFTVRCDCCSTCWFWLGKWSNPPGWCGLHWIRGCPDKLPLWLHHYWLLPLWGCWCSLFTDPYVQYLHITSQHYVSSSSLMPQTVHYIYTSGNVLGQDCESNAEKYICTMQFFLPMYNCLNMHSNFDLLLTCIIYNLASHV